jgi:hypothetical protein
MCAYHVNYAAAFDPLRKMQFLISKSSTPDFFSRSLFQVALCFEVQLSKIKWWVGSVVSVRNHIITVSCLFSKTMPLIYR